MMHGINHLSLTGFGYLKRCHHTGSTPLEMQDAWHFSQGKYKFHQACYLGSLVPLFNQPEYQADPPHHAMNICCDLRLQRTPMQEEFGKTYLFYLQMYI